jgi:hypothetical protein
MTTREAFLASMRATVWFSPNLTKRGFLESFIYGSEEGAHINGSTHFGRSVLVLSGSGGGRLEASLFLELGLGAVLVEQLEELRGGVLVEGVGELRDGGGHLEALVQDDLLALEADVLGPLDEARQVGLGLDVLA